MTSILDVHSSILASFWKLQAYGQPVLPDRLISIVQKLMENAKIQYFKWDISGDFQTMCVKANIFIIQKN